MKFSTGDRVVNSNGDTGAIIGFRDRMTYDSIEGMKAKTVYHVAWDKPNKASSWEEEWSLGLQQPKSSPFDLSPYLDFVPEMFLDIVQTEEEHKKASDPEDEPITEKDLKLEIALINVIIDNSLDNKDEELFYKSVREKNRLLDTLDKLLKN